MLFMLILIPETTSNRPYLDNLSGLFPPPFFFLFYKTYRLSYMLKTLWVGRIRRYRCSPHHQMQKEQGNYS